MQVGFNISNVKSKNNDSTLSKAFIPKSGIAVVTMVFIRIHPLLEVKTGANISNIGYQEKFTVAQDQITIKTVLLYAQVPLTIKGTFVKNYNGSFYYEAGGYFGKALEGFTRTNKEGDNSDFQAKNEKFEIGNSKNDDFKPLDYGVRVGLGLNFNSLDLGATYNWGMTTIATDATNGFSAKNRFFQMVLIYKV